MALHRMVNGKKIMLSPEEEKLKRAEWAETTAKEKAVQYMEDRQNEYPPFAQQFDAMWHEMAEHGSLNSSGDWFKSIAAIKSKYPKP